MHPIEGLIAFFKGLYWVWCKVTGRAYKREKVMWP
jgi:hypothetical protein